MKPFTNESHVTSGNSSEFNAVQGTNTPEITPVNLQEEIKRLTSDDTEVNDKYAPPNKSHTNFLKATAPALIKHCNFIQMHTLAYLKSKGAKKQKDLKDGQKETLEQDIKKYLKKGIPQSYLASLFIDGLNESLKKKEWELRHYDGTPHIYNGKFWKPAHKDYLKPFFTDAAIKMGIKIELARTVRFRRELCESFFDMNVITPTELPKDVITVNLNDGTYTFEKNGELKKRKHNPGDFFRYVLPFNYNPKAERPKFNKYLATSLPDPDSQLLLQEAFGAILLKGANKHKAYFLQGTGRNGKSLAFKILKGVLGKENISNASLKQLCDSKGATIERLEREGKLANFSDEIEGEKINVAMFKSITSNDSKQGERKFKDARDIEHICPTYYSCNDLPKVDNEGSAFYERLILIPFNDRIPEKDRIDNLHEQIIKEEAAGVFNWLLEGARRLLKNGKFSKCEKSEECKREYQISSNSFISFLDKEGYVKDLNPTDKKAHIPIEQFETDYAEYCCKEYLPSITPLTEGKVKNLGFLTKRRSHKFGIYLKSKRATNE